MKRSDAVYATLKKDILEWVLPPGSAVAEQDLAQKLGASRTPVREALQRLSREGLVNILPRKGAFVSEISVPNIVELFQMRQALEPMAARLAARSEYRQSIRTFIPELEAAVQIIGDHANSEYYSLTARLDSSIVDLASNAQLLTALRQVWDQSYRTRRLAYADRNRLTQTVSEHLEIVNEIASGSEEAAAEAAFAHLAQSLNHFLAILSDPQRAARLLSMRATNSTFALPPVHGN